MDALKALNSLGLGGQTSGPEGDKLVQQAQHIWSMLDDMAASDPQAYSRFIEKQGKEYRNLHAPPEPHMCVKTQLRGGTLYINIVSWPQVPKPKSAEDNVPLFAAPIDNFKDKKEGTTVSSITVATNPEVLSDYGVDSNDVNERNGFINLTMDYVQHLCGAPVSRNFTLLPRSTAFKGDLEKAQNFFKDTLKRAMKKDKEEKGEKQPVPDVDIPESMLSQLANISVTADSNAHQSNGSSGNFSDNSPILLPETKSEKPAAKKNLIQELKSEVVKLKEPRHVLEKSPSGDSLVLRIELPGVSSVSQCQLDISEDDVKLYVEGQYDLTVKLPSRIDDLGARAKFSKKQCSLTLHMPCVVP